MTWYVLVLTAALMGEITDLPIITSFQSPLQGEEWKPDVAQDAQFGADCTLAIPAGGSKHWGHHTAEDKTLSAGTPVLAPADGRVMYAGKHDGTPQKQNFGGIVILVHRTAPGAVIYTLFAHMDVDPEILSRFQANDRRIYVKQGQAIGKVAAGNTPGNGYWPAHLHYGINLDPLDKYRGGILAGYDQQLKDGQPVLFGPPNRLKDWVAPSKVYAQPDRVRFLNKEMVNPLRR